MSHFKDDQENRLIRLATALIDQSRARVIVPPNQHSSGFWFGGGNLIEAPDGTLYLTGRFRNHGDSRTGLGAGDRGLELSVYRSQDRGDSFEKVLSFSKQDLALSNRDVLSIEGSALHVTPSGFELFVSSEKTAIDYPAGLEQFLKPGAGVWTIERLHAESIEGFQDSPIETVLESRDSVTIHIKDPSVFDLPSGDLMLLFCSHPFCWSSSNTGFAIRPANSDRFEPPVFDFFPRGPAWDVAITRGTALLDVPQVGVFQNTPATLLFYDGGESLRNLDEHSAAVKRPRGYSCEELGGLAVVGNHDFSRVTRLSECLPLFVSPHGTGCSRYVDVLATADDFFVTWQQAQPDGSQPLVMNRVGRNEVEKLLA